MSYLAPSDVRIRCPDAPDSVDPHRSIRRGMAIRWKNGGESTGWVYATFKIPVAASSFTVKAAFQRWDASGSTSFTTKTYLDTVGDGDSLPEDTTGQTNNQSADGNVSVVNLVNGSAQAGQSIFATFSLYNLSAGVELALHDLWIEY